ncbi:MULTISPECIES: hypothetical protein [Chloroflexus]|uniref:hypothetical protein n=1 Tax=Chloroflexus TaxID=1107 RepID=UPI0012FF0196|nr:MULTISPECIES: hypothetical protein [Chloroflexus]
MSSLVGWGALPACHAHDAAFGVRQPCCRASRAHDPARGTLLIRLVTWIQGVLITILESPGNE